MNPIVLHIGTTKTGTSSLQSFLDRHTDSLAEAGFVYPAAGRVGQARMTHHNLYYETRLSDQGNDTYDPSRGGWKDVLSEVDNVPRQTGIISSEGFQYSVASQVDRVAEILNGRRVKIVVYLRRHDRWLESAWNQRARFGRVSLSFADFFETDGKVVGDYSRTLSPWLKSFGDASVDVRVYDSIADVPGIIADFTSAYVSGMASVGPDSSVLRRNQKAGLKHLVAVSVVMAACRESMGEDFVLSRRSAMRISSFFRDRDDCYDFSVLSFEDAIGIERHFNESDEILARASTSFRRSGPFMTPQAGDFHNHVDFSDPSALFEEEFDQEEERFVRRMIREIAKAAKARVRAEP